MNDDELKLYYQMYLDCWQFTKHHKDVQNTEEWWRETNRTGHDLYEKYKDLNETVIKAIIVGMLWKFQDEVKGQEVQNG